MLFVDNLMPKRSFHMWTQALSLLNVTRDGANVLSDAVTTASLWVAWAAPSTGWVTPAPARCNPIFSRLHEQDANVQHNSGIVFLPNSYIRIGVCLGSSFGQ